MADLNKEFMEQLYDAEKVLVDDVEWDQTEPGSDRYTLRTNVRTTSRDEILTLVGEYWAGGKYSYSLRYDNTMIRVWDFNHHHEGIDGGHKHRYPHSQLIEDEDDPYNVNHIPTSDPHQALKEFMDECNIKQGDATLGQIPNLTNYE